MEKRALVTSSVFHSGHFKTKLVENACMVRLEKCTKVGQFAAGVLKSFLEDKNRKQEPI